jgi:hypothetical protein
LLGVPEKHIDDNRLYRALDQLLPHKAALEIHLKNRLGELFDLEYDLLLYDVTSTSFEGRCHAQCGLLSASHQRHRLVRRRTVEGLHPADRSRSRVLHSQK